jgi:hypothetical protein
MLFPVLTGEVVADRGVAVVSWADPAYTQRKFGESPPRTESFVVMQGRRFESPTRDDSLTKLDFRKIAEALAIELARENYVPAKDVASSDLLLLVHWGTTSPRVSTDSLQGVTTFGVPDDRPPFNGEVPEPRNEGDTASQFFVNEGERYREYAFQEAERATDRLEDDFRNASNANLLGYTEQLRRLARKPGGSTIEHTLRSDLQSERYFIIVKAYDLKAPRAQGARRKPVWTLHMNMRSPGQNFKMAISRMSTVAVNFAGKSNPDMVTATPGQRTGVVTIGPLKVIGVVD